MSMLRLSLLFIAAMLCPAVAHAAAHGSAPASCPYSAYSNPGTMPYDGCSQASQSVIAGLSFQDNYLFAQGPPHLFQSGPGATFMATSSGDTLTVTSVSAGTILGGQFIRCAGYGAIGNSLDCAIPGWTQVDPYGTGSTYGTGGTGTYHTNQEVGTISTAIAMTNGQVVGANLHNGPSTAVANWNVAGEEFPTGITTGPNSGGAWCNGPYSSPGSPSSPCSSTTDTVNANQLIDPSLYDWATDPLKTGCIGSNYTTTGNISAYSVYCDNPSPFTAAEGNPCGDTSICIQGFDWAPGGATFTGSISGNTLTTSGVTGNIVVGATIQGSGVVPAQITATSGSSWTINGSPQSVSAEAMSTKPRCVGLVFKDKGSVTSGTVHFRNNRVSYYNDISCVNASNNYASGGYAQPVGLLANPADNWTIDVENNFVDGNGFNSIVPGTTTVVYLTSGATEVEPNAWFFLAQAPINVQTLGSLTVEYNHFQNLNGRAVTINLSCGGLYFNYNTIHNLQVNPGGGHAQIYEYNAPPGSTPSTYHCPGVYLGASPYAPDYMNGIYGTMTAQIQINNTSWNDNSITGGFYASSWNLDVPQDATGSGGDLLDIPDFEFRLNTTVTNTINYNGTQGVYFAIQPPTAVCTGGCSNYTVGDIVQVNAKYDGGAKLCEVPPTALVYTVVSGAPTIVKTARGGVCAGGAPTGTQLTASTTCVSCANPAATGLQVTEAYAYDVTGGLLWVGGVGGTSDTALAGHVNYEQLNIINNIMDQDSSNQKPYPTNNKGVVPLMSCASPGDVMAGYAGHTGTTPPNLLPYNYSGPTYYTGFTYHNSTVSNNYEQDGFESNEEIYNGGGPPGGPGLYSASGC